MATALVPLKADLVMVEAKIQECLDKFVELGRWLTVINSERLYQQTYASFEAYCWERWRIGRHRAYQLIGAAQTADYLLTIGLRLQPENERQYRTLGQLPMAERAAVWQAALEDAEGGQPAARDIADLVAAKMAELSDQEQLQVTSEYERRLLDRRDKAAAPREPNEPRTLTRLEKALQKINFVSTEDEEDGREVLVRLERMRRRRAPSQ